ncbi:MAG: ISKra4 family transposase [Chloroflexota bacterium]
MSKYNSEAVQNLAQEVANLLSETLAQGEHIGEIEHKMRELLQEVGQKSLEILLEEKGKAQERKIRCDCGGTLDYVGQRPATVISVFGRVTYKRAYYSGCGCGKGKAPLDEELRLNPGAVTIGLSNLLSLAGIQFSFQESCAWLKEFLLFEVSENTVRQETERMGQIRMKIEKEWIAQSQREDWLQMRQRQDEPVADTLYCAIDAAKTRTEPRPKAGQTKEPHEDWRDVKCLVWFEAEEVPSARQKVRERSKTARQEVPRRAVRKQYACDITDSTQFGELLWATGCQGNADRCSRLVFLGDGAPWIWNLVQTHFPHAIQIVDWYHAEEHLEQVARAAFAADVHQQQAWLENTKQALWEGQVEDVIQACQALAKRCEEAAKNARYFSEHSERMRYNRFRKQGLMIGSGVVESGCKQIVTQRLKLPGAQWLVDGAIYTAKARAAWLSGQWQTLCQERANLPLAI